MDSIADYFQTRSDPRRRDAVALHAVPVTKEINDSAHKCTGRSDKFRTALSAKVKDQLKTSLAVELKYWGFPER